jgi:hypothetical protein
VILWYGGYAYVLWRLYVKEIEPPLVVLKALTIEKQTGWTIVDEDTHKESLKNAKQTDVFPVSSETPIFFR